MIKARLTASCAAAALGASVACPAASAQDFRRVAPKELPAEPTVSPPAPEASSAPSAKDQQTIVPVLRGLVFVADPAAINPAGSTVSGVQANGLAPIAEPQVQTMLSAFIGQPLTFGRLRAITDAVVATYRRDGRPVVRAVVPQQNVDSGTIQVVVTEFRVGKIVATGNRHFSDAQIIAPFRLKHGDPIDADAVSQALDQANANPFRRVELVYTPSAEIGYTDLVLQTRDRLPFRPYVSYDTTGARVTGRDRYSIGFNWGRAFGADQILSYQFSTSRDLFSGDNRADGRHHTAFMSHSLYWSVPFSWGDTLSIFGAYERSDPNIGQDFNLIGHSGQASIRYRHRLPAIGRIRQDLQIGFDFKTTNNNLDFGGTSISRADTDVDQFLATYSANRPDALGVTGISATLTASPGGLTANNTDSAFQPTLTQAGRLGARANYFYARGELDRLTILPQGASWSLRIVGQVSNRPLVETEQLSLGGAETLRGYEPNAVNGDEGVFISNELRTPSLSPFANARGHLLAFVDWARLSNKRPAPGEVGAFSATSAGLGARFSVGTHVQLKADYGWQLQRLPGQARLGELGTVSLVIGY